MLRIQNLTKTFGGVEAIKGSNFEIPKYNITALIGPNGAGKTTLFDIVCGLVQPDSGKIFFNNIDITNREPHGIANLGISRTFQQVRLFKNLTIGDHLVMVENNEDTKLFKNISKFVLYNTDGYIKLLKNFSIEKPLDTRISDLSFGQRKLLQILMALQKPHSLLMLDEPVAGVNSVIQEKIEKLLLELKNKNETILLIDHDINFIRKLADHVIVLDAGQVICEGTPNDVLQNELVIKAYLGK
jgi:branched-chain amino acid transport system ATP-binding protein